nr:MAG TPA: hypothetical protein [Caudoviricetes sp.]
MLNKEQLLMGNTVGQQPVALTVGVFDRRDFHYYGFDAGYFGTLAPVPFWGDNVRLGTLAYFEDEYRTRCAPTDRSCFFTVYISGYENTPIDTGETKEGDYYNFSAKVDQTVYLTFDPPPRRLSGSQDTQTNLEYYVEEDPWEAQNAEQGTSDDRWCRGVVDSAIKFHRGLLYKTEIAGFRRAPSLGGISANRYLNVSRTSRSNEVALSLLFCWGTRIHKRRGVYSRLLQQARDRNFSASKQGVSRNKLRSVTSKEALYA